MYYRIVSSAKRPWLAPRHGGDSVELVEARGDLYELRSVEPAWHQHVVDAVLLAVTTSERKA